MKAFFSVFLCVLCASVVEVGPAIAQDRVVVAGQDGIPAPKRIRTVNPVYPQEALAQGVRGIVILEILIDPQGKVASAEVIRSLPLLDEAALAAVRKWEYEVTKVDGKPVSVKLTVPITFALRLPEVTRAPGIPELRQGAGIAFPAGQTEGASVTAQVTLAPDGQVAEADVVKGTAPFSVALLQALRTWRFAPDSENVILTFQVEADFVPPARGDKGRVDLRLTSLRRSESVAAPSTPATGPLTPSSPGSSPEATAETRAAPAPDLPPPPAEPGLPPLPPPGTVAPVVPNATAPAAATPASEPAPPRVPPPTSTTPAPTAPAPPTAPTTPPATPTSPAPRSPAPTAAPPVAGPPVPATPRPGTPASEARPTTPPSSPRPAMAPPPVEVLTAPPPPGGGEANAAPALPGVSAVKDVTLALGVPDLVRGRRPVPPPLARMSGTTGSVEVKFGVDAAGATSVSEVAGPEALKTAAAYTVQSWLFRRVTVERLHLVASFDFAGDTAKVSVRPE